MKIRSFVAINLSNEIQTKLNALVKEIRERSPLSVRWTQIENIHITLKFLGSVEEKQIPEIERVVQNASIGYHPFFIKVGGLGVFPHVERPRIVWVGCEFEEMGLLLQSSLEAGLKALGFDREKRNFHPHLTLGRVNQSLSRSDALQIGAMIREKQNKKIGSMQVDKFLLFRSDLHPDGARYQILRTFPLNQ